MKKDKQINVIAIFISKPENIDETKKLLSSMLGPCRKIPGCLDYHAFQDDNNHNKFLFVETWASQDAVDAHLKSDYFVNIRSKIEILLANPPEITLLNPL